MVLHVSHNPQNVINAINYEAILFLFIFCLRSDIPIKEVWEII